MGVVEFRRMALARLRLMLALSVMLSFAFGANAAERLDFSWRNVVIGGGGYVTGIVAHPRVQDLIYVRTDVGGLFRYNATPDALGRRWVPLLDSFGLCCSNYYGVESVAIDPRDPDVVFVAIGKDQWAGKGTVLKSTDRGKTWHKTDLGVTMQANGPFKEGGERLLVDPTDSQTVYFASRDNGLWRSENGGENWTEIKTAPRGTGPAGLTFIIADNYHASLNQPHRATLFVSAYEEGLFRSDDGGDSWTKIEGGPTHGLRGAITANGSMFIAGEDGVARYQQGRWSDITPEKGQRYCGLAVSAARSGMVIVSQSAAKFQVPFFVSSNNGDSWKTYSTVIGNVTAKPDVPWLGGWQFAGATSALLIDPNVMGRLWLTDWSGIWRTDNYRANPMLFQTLEAGHEELVISSLATPPRGLPLLSTAADAKGFRHVDLDRYPSETFEDAGVWASFGIDYFVQDPNLLVRVGVREGYGSNAKGGVALSRDNGKHWTRTGWPEDKHPAKVAYSATDPNRIVVVPVGDVPRWTADRGTTWAASTGVPGDVIMDFWRPDHPLAADRKNGQVFYLFHAGVFYRSDDGGKSWSARSKIPGTNRIYVEAEPGLAGTVWVSLDSGLFVSSDGGDSFKQITSVRGNRLFGLGRGRTAGSRAALYIYGDIGEGEARLYMSENLGESWSDITDPSQMMGADPSIMRGDMQTFGQVYLGTGGRGLFVGRLKTSVGAGTKPQ
jgi:photosystem II stability/assembly factor-like uncharacterized protein